jgi:hypothetical protein
MPSLPSGSSAATRAACAMLVIAGASGCGMTAAATGDGDASDDASVALRDAAADASLDAGSPSCVLAPPSMIAWWSGDGDLTDRVGGLTGASGTQNGATTVTFAAGEVAAAFDQHGASYVQVPNAPALAEKTALTIEAWFYATALGGRVLDKNTAGGSDGYMLDTYQNKARMIIGKTSVSSPTDLPTGVWTHVAGTYDGALVSVFVNGTLAASAPRTGAIPTNTLAVRIGADSAGKNRFAGLLDEVVLYSRALAPTELAAVVAGGSRGRCWP